MGSKASCFTMHSCLCVSLALCVLSCRCDSFRENIWTDEKTTVGSPWARPFCFAAKITYSPVLISMEEQAIEVIATPLPVKRKRGNPAWVKGMATSPNPAGVVATEKKPIRKILLNLLEKPLDEKFEPRTRGERLANEYFLSVFACKAGSKAHAAALERICDRIDGRNADETVEQPLQVRGNNLVLVGTKNEK